MPVGWEYATRIDAQSPCYTQGTRRPSFAPDESSSEHDDALQRGEPPAGWTRSRSGSWEGWTPREWAPRLQGWKIHVSATRQDARPILDAVTAICLERGVAFKFLPTLTDLWMANAKHADRASAGKFITVYPHDDHELAALLSAFESALDGRSGPYILSDLRAGEAPVYVRYGGIYPLSYRDAQGESVAALVRGTHLALTEDVREPRFAIPDGVELPPCLEDAWTRHRRDVSSPIDGYASIASLGFSNAGGVYLAVLPDGTRHVLKEARPHAGWDATGRSAVDRQLHEERVLADLRGCRGVQPLLGSFTAWEHRFLVLGYLEGTPLVKWAAAHYPLHYVDRVDDPARLAAYRRSATGAVAQLTAIIESVHARGWCVGDLHPGNVLIDDDGAVGLVDLEDATPIDAPREIGMRVVEYCAPDGFSARAADWYAAARIAMNLYVTGWPAEVICPEHWERCLHLVRERLGEEAAAQIEELERRARETEPGTTTEGTRADALRAGGATAAATGGTTVADRPRHALSPRVVAELPPREPEPLARVIDALADFTDWSRRFSATQSYPGDPVLGGRLPWACWETGLAGVVFARSRIGRPVADDVVDRLETVTEVLAHDGPIGLNRGLAGMALALHESGRGDRAAHVLSACLERVEEVRRRDLYDGRAGTILAALEVACAAGDAALRRQALRAYRRFTGEEPGPGPRKPGLAYGESGVAVLDLMVAFHTGDRGCVRSALRRIRADAAGCEIAGDGTCLVSDEQGGRLLPYLEWGSAGVLAAAHLAARFTGTPPDAPRQDAPAARGPLLDAASHQGILHACSSRMYVYDGLHHGRAGILAALLAAGPAGAVAADFQARHLAATLPTIAGHRCVVGDGLIRLSADLATGAAGVALALHCYDTAQPFGWLPVAAATARALAPGAAPAAGGAPPVDRADAAPTRAHPATHGAAAPVRA